MGNLFSYFSDIRVFRLDQRAQISRGPYEQPAGIDLVALQDTVIKEKAFGVRVSTGVNVEFGEGFYGTIEGRSGLALKGILVHRGTIENDFCGILDVICHNLSDTAYMVKAGDRIASLLLQKQHLKNVLEASGPRPMTLRGEKGFGSSGR